MFSPIKVVELEISQPLPTVEARGYAMLHGLVRCQGIPTGWIHAPVVNGFCSATELKQIILDQHSDAIWQQVWINALAAGKLSEIQQWGNLSSTDRAAIPELLSSASGAPQPIELSQLQALKAGRDCPSRLMVTNRGIGLGEVSLTDLEGSMGRRHWAEAIVKQIGWQQLTQAQGLTPTPAILEKFLGLDTSESAEKLPADISVSIVVGTFNRPETLRTCLTHLLAQVSPRSIEILVVDNYPASGLTPPVVAEFPTVKLVSEARQGVAYARNAGIIASTGEIIVTVDDDVVMPPDWLETLLAPFVATDVTAVTGNVLPLELETPAQQLFEQYGDGGLGRGFESFTVGSDWFKQSRILAVPTWKLGATANSAYRARIFDDSAIGLMDEALGPGMPSGVGEDIYLFYKILQAGGTIRYQAQAYVWHQHRRELTALKRQIYNYSKGITSYHLTTLLRDRDYRAFFTLFLFLPLYHVKQCLFRLGNVQVYPLSLIAVEVAGNLAGFWSLWQSRQRVQQQGRSTADGTRRTAAPSLGLPENRSESPVQNRPVPSNLPLDSVSSKL